MLCFWTILFISTLATLTATSSFFSCFVSILIQITAFLCSSVFLLCGNWILVYVFLWEMGTANSDVLINNKLVCDWFFRKFKMFMCLGCYVSKLVIICLENINHTSHRSAFAWSANLLRFHTSIHLSLINIVLLAICFIANTRAASYTNT